MVKTLLLVCIPKLFCVLVVIVGHRLVSWSEFAVRNGEREKESRILKGYKNKNHNMNNINKNHTKEVREFILSSRKVIDNRPVEIWCFS